MSRNTFMQYEVTAKQCWFKLDHPIDGITFFDAKVVTLTDLTFDYGKKVKDWIEEVEGYGARLTAPGYLDCTEWEVCTTRQDAMDYLRECYPDLDPDVTLETDANDSED